MANNNRDEFLPAVKKVLAERAGNRCSYPNCGAPTSGPNDEAADSSSNVGMACHIVAAASGRGARRVDEHMSSELCAAADNGIWMCYTHGKLIDTDEERFTIPMLQKWRALAELRARLSVEHGKPIDLSPRDMTEMMFAGDSIILTGMGEENRRIGDAFRHTCVGVIWGEEPARCVRDASIELARNAFSHGKASLFSVEIRERSIKLRDDGAAFDVRTLPAHKSGQGGGIAIKHLLEKYGDTLVITHCRDGEVNEVVIAMVHTLKDVRNATPCTVTISHEDVLNETMKIEVDDLCDTVYLILTPFVTVSDIFMLVTLLEKRGPDSRQFVFVLDDPSESVRGLFSKNFRQYKFISVADYRRG